MKNISLAVVLILSLVFSSCNIAGNSTGPNPEEDSSRSGSTGITDVASVTESQSESIIPVVPEFRFNKEDTRIFWRERASAIQYSDLEDSMDASYSRIIWGTDPAAITLPVLSILPEESGSSKSSGNDSRNDNIYHVGSLGLDLKIPEGYYLYRVNGRYKDPDGNPAELEFVDEYIFTVKDVTEEQLISDMILFPP